MLQTKTPARASATLKKIKRYSSIIELSGQAATTIHIVRYARQHFKPKIVAFKEATVLQDWCAATGVEEAISGGFFLRDSEEALGDLWIAGREQPSAAITAPWHAMRGSVHITRDGQLSVGPRSAFPLEPVHDLLQAGPLLTVEGVSVVTDMQDPEGFSSASHQFDSDISKGRYPRAAIGLSRKYIWSIACDGRSEQDAGLTLAELAQIMLMLGAEDALNLDGGSSASQVSGGKLRNRSRGDGISFPQGRPIHTAIIFA